MTDDYFRYSFSYTGNGENIDYTINETDDNLITWPLVLNKFIKFLEMTYGYEIMPKVRLKHSRFIDTDTDWHGEFFDVPEEDTDEQVDDKAGLTE